MGNYKAVVNLKICIFLEIWYNSHEKQSIIENREEKAR